ncbi:MAG: LptF/LptG family permease [Pyrinomonadaceae bacterium]
MKRLSWLISKYLVSTVIPYFVFSWLLLSVILFVQQASRFSDIFFSVNIPANLIWQLTVALIPSVIAFTCPMAMLVGTIIGLTKMQSDSELVAIRASGVGKLQIALPIMILGMLMSAFAFIVNLEGVPLAAKLVRSVALQTAIKKLESPIEPGVFNSEVAGYTIYVKDGDFETGRWKNIFIYSEDRANATMRLITSQQGRIDTSDQLSELVLENAAVTTLPITPGQGKYVSESIGEVRFAIRTRRSDLIEKLSSSQLTPEELGLQQLSEYASSKDGKERVEAQILWQRRIILSVTPLIFCLLGTVIVLRFNRGGRGFGILLALGVLIGFYLLAFLGEQLARVGVIGVLLSSLIPIAGSAAAIIWFSSSRKINVWTDWANNLQTVVATFRVRPITFQTRNLFVDLTTGLRDFDIVQNLGKNFLLTLCFLSAIFVIFTAFELWKFAGTIDGGVLLLTKYLFYLLPFIYLQIAPSAAMIGTLATYVIKSRQNEIVIWTSTGQSVYRLLMPCFIMMLLLGGTNWLIQERILPTANQRQDATRTLIRNRGIPVNQSGKYWVANEKRIYSFDLASDNDIGIKAASNKDETPISTSDNDKARGGSISQVASGSSPLFLSLFSPPVIAILSASDNEKRFTNCRAACVKNLSIYEFADNGEKLQFVYRSDLAMWENGQIRFLGNVERDDLKEGKISTKTLSGGELGESANPFAELRTKPSHINSSELKLQIAAADSELDQRNLTVALEKKYTTLFLPFIMALFTAPFSLSLSRKGKVATIGYAVALWLLFTGTSILFEQLGLNATLAPSMAVWSPLAIFSLIGIYLLSKVRT